MSLLGKEMAQLSTLTASEVIVKPTKPGTSHQAKRDEESGGQVQRSAR